VTRHEAKEGMLVTLYVENEWERQRESVLACERETKGGREEGREVGREVQMARRREREGGRKRKSAHAHLRARERYVERASEQVRKSARA